MNIPKPTQQLKIALLVFATLGAVQSQAMVCRVTTDGTNTGDGSDWNGQAMDLHTALGDIDCSEIWVKAGVYKPHASDRSVSFTIARQVQVYGGFAGTESEREARDPVAHPGILSGDIDDNDTINPDGVTEHHDDIQGENSFHVLWMDGTTASGPITQTTIVDGFTITGGHANEAAPNNMGGGLHCAAQGEDNECSPRLSHLAFYGNLASSAGGAMANNGSNGGNSSPTLHKVIFSGNNAATGGAMYNGGGNGSSDPALDNVTFSGNSANRGGAVYGSASNPTLVNVTFSDNSAVGNNPTGGDGGGAMYNSGGIQTLINVTFSGNEATQDGGALHNRVGTQVLTNVTFTDNSANNLGGAIYNIGAFGETFSQLTNVILWGNHAGLAEPNIYNRDFGTTSCAFSYGVIESPCPNRCICAFTSHVDPSLGPLQDNGGFTQTIHPGTAGPAIDTGSPIACPEHDQRGVSRPMGGGCDIGAVEWFQAANLAVEVSGLGSANAGEVPEPFDGGIIDCDEAGIGQAQCAAQYAEGASENVTLTLTPGDQHWHISAVAGCGGELDGDTFIIGWLNSHCTVSVTFSINQYILQYSAGPGGVVVGQQTQTVDHGANGELVAAFPDENYQFMQWSDGNVDNPRTDINVTESLSVTAEFAPSEDSVFDDRFEHSGQ